MILSESTEREQSKNPRSRFHFSRDAMKDGDLLPTSATVIAGGKFSTAVSEATLFGRGRCKCWALAAISLLAFWSMLASTVTLKWTAGNLKGIYEDLDSLSHEDLDILELEEREMVVRHMWDVYTHSRRIRFPRFWQEAFEAAYEELASDEVEVRESAVREIARMSMRMVDLEPPPRKAMNSAGEISHVGRESTTEPKSSLSS